MDHILLLAAIALVVLTLGAIWKWLKKMQRRSRIRRGNNYLYQEYNYDYDINHDAIDSAWEVHRKEIVNKTGEKETCSDTDLDLSLELDDNEPGNKGNGQIAATYEDCFTNMANGKDPRKNSTSPSSEDFEHHETR